MVEGPPKGSPSQGTRDRSEHPLPTTSSGTIASYVILQVLSVQDRSVSSSEIAQKTGLNPSSVRARLSELRKKGLVHRDYPGAYSIEPTYGVGILGRVPPRVQNLRVTARGVKVRVHDDAVVKVGDLVVRVLSLIHI